MIIELFGPPGAGKTTFARALAAGLRERGHGVELRLSCRPAERLPTLDSRRTESKRFQNVVIQRLSQPVADMLQIARHPFANSRDLRTAARLVRFLPPANVVSFIKISQYLSRLSHSWYQKSSAAYVVLFDQAFVQAVFSLALLARATDDNLIASAFDFAPKSDVFIRLEAPLALLEARLAERMRLQGTVERLFESDPKKSLASVPLFDGLHDLLVNQGGFVLCASSLDKRSLHQSVDTIAQRIIAKFKAGGNSWPTHA